MINKDTWLLTTLDNPINPFSDWDSWYRKDLDLGYDTCGLLARYCTGSLEIDDEGIYEAMTRVVENNWSGQHIMVTESTWANLIPT